MGFPVLDGLRAIEFGSPRESRRRLIDFVINGMLAGARAYGAIAVAFWWTTSRRAAPPAGTPSEIWSAPSGVVEPTEQELTS